MCQTTTEPLLSTLEELLKRRDRDMAVERIIAVLETDVMSPGVNFLSCVKRITVKVTRGSGKTATESVIQKELPSKTLTRQAVIQWGLFLKEFTCYRDVLPLLEDFLEENGCKEEVLWPRCIDIRPYDRIILEDLKPLGYKLANKFDGLDLDHCILVMKSLGMYHALTLVAKERYSLQLDILSKVYAFHGDRPQSEFVSGLQDLAIALKSWGSEWQSASDKLEKIIPNVTENFKEMLTFDENRVNVLNHGDCWTNNVLLKYDFYTGKPVQVKFVDFQMAHHNTLALDLVFFLSTSPTLEVRHNHVDRLVQVYHESLTLNMIRFEVANTKQPSLNYIRDEIKRLGLLKLFLIVVLLPRITGKKEHEAFDIEDSLKQQIACATEDNPGKMINFIDVNDDYWSAIVKITLKEAIENEIL